MQDKYHEIVLVAIAAIATFVVLTGTVVFILLYYQKKKFTHSREISDMQGRFNQEILQTKLETQEETFQQIAKDLHDNVGQLLSSTKMLIGVAQQNKDNSTKALNTADETLATSIESLRALSRSLDRDWLDRFSFIENLSMEAERMQAINGMKFIFHHPLQLSLTSESQVMLFRIVQEALQNAVKHARANFITVTVEEKTNRLYIVICDNGNGFEPGKATAKGMGMMNIKNRTHLLNGDVEWKSQPGTGTTVTISLPL